jgi:protein involved in polysaccharide export with SLBB domain
VIVRILVLLLCLIIGAPWQALASEPYRLGPGDRLRIDVLDQPALSREATVQGDGAIRLPRVGTVPLGGLTLEGAHEALNRLLVERMGLIAPDLALEIVAHRPVYITGDVQTPGAHAYVSGMTVMNLIALAGGYRRVNADDAVSRLEVGRLVERLAQMRDQLAISHLRLARFRAELDDLPDPPAPPELTRLVTAARAEDIRAQEARLRVERRNTFDEALANTGQQRGQLTREVDSLEARRVGKLQQIAILQREVALVRGLQDRQLSPVTRGFELDRTLIGYEGDLREIDAAMARARREVALLDQRDLTLRSDRRLEIVNGIKEFSDALAQQREAVANVEAQIDVARGLTFAVGAATDPQGQVFEQLMVLRRGAGRFVPIGLIDPVLPDDLVVVPRPRSARTLD